jgi:hypothetical protein
MRTRSITVLFCATVAAASGTARADTTDEPRPPEARRTDRTRAYHAIAIGAMATAYGLSEFVFKDTFAPDECGWCNPPGVDRSVRDALVWDEVSTARGLSNVTGFGLAPALSIGTLVLSGGGYGRRRVFDDVAPVLEAAAAVSLINQTIKFTFGRSRPFVRFGDPNMEHHPDDNLSFFSGHTSFTFALAVSAGMVAHRRHYKAEPVIWAGGLALAAGTGYLRIAGDKHYFSDVVLGAIAGTAAGIVVPLWLHDEVLGKDVNIVPTGKGVAIVGSF